MSDLDFVPTVPAWFRALAERHGPRELLVQGGERLRFADAEARSARLARALVAQGFGKGTRVGILLPNGPDWVVAWLASARIGAIAVPINTFFQTRELGWMLRHADVQVLLLRPRFLTHDYLARLEEIAPELAAGELAAGELAAGGLGAGELGAGGLAAGGLAGAGPIRSPALPCLRRVFCFGPSERAWATPVDALLGAAEDVDARLLEAIEASVAPADPLVILYSSGSTADPKGAVHSHGSLLRHSFALTRLRDLEADDRVWSPMPFFWVGGLVFALLGNLHVGACTLCEEVFDAGRTLEFLERERVTVAVGWPHFGKALVEHPSFRSRDLSSLRAGNIPDLLPPDILPPDPELRPNGLGMTETCGPHTYTGDRPLPESLRGAMGKALRGIAHKVVDPATGAPVAPGEVGELCVRGYNVMQGLYKVEREQTFDADGFYHTGDSGRFDPDGVLYFKGRLGEMIKTGGANVTPSEVESALRAHAEVKEAFVVGVPDPERGQNVAAAVVLVPGQAVPADELVARLRRELAAYKVPKHLYVFGATAELPFTDSGKIDKRRLERLLAARIAGEA
jgi:acyl-CoA synthetase (AMP-forming)/AMP-acid ligase II